MKIVLVLCFTLFVASASAAPPSFCVAKADEGKCNAAVVKGFNVTCKTADDAAACVAMVAKGDADLALATADGMVNNVKNLKIVLAEKYQGVTDFVRYYGVAVVKKDSGLALEKLKGKKTCHTGVGKTAGWKIPVGYLLRKKVMPLVKDQYQSVASFFGSSCVPGIKDKVKDSKITNKLCKLCNNTCTSKDGYADYEGAYLCMTSGSGEVAFVKHSTPIGKTNSSDYSLLCRDDKQKGVSEYETCYIDKRPAGAIVTGNGKDAAAITMYRTMVNDVTIKNLTEAGILDKSVVGLNTTDKSTSDYLGDYLGDLKALNEVNGGSSVAGWLLLQLIPAFFVFVF